MAKRTVQVSDITEKLADLCASASCELDDDLINGLEEGLRIEESPTGKQILEQILENARISRETKLPSCQDTGFAVVFLEIGQDACLEGGDLMEAVNEGVRRGYEQAYLRKSIVDDPAIDRKNTRDNTPAVVHTEIVKGDRVKITLAAKGGGSENMSGVAMLKPADGIEGVKRFVVDKVKQAGGNPCPPVIIGVGIGGTFEKCALLAKKALLRPLGSHHPDKRYAKLEKELLSEINASGVGPQGLGGRVTALGVQVETFPCHIASLPVAVNVNCHASRHKEAIV
ncbi:MAG: fumarate hydratase [Candidatus Eiseniibacteriota bacterium]|nr:MAG: fumarate hydratase [Candidatus Eisenbacteria bacterium]